MLFNRRFERTGMEEQLENDLAYFSARELVECYRRQDLSPIEVTRTMLERIERLNPQLNAIYHLSTEAALRQAAASEARWRRGEPAGPLDGVPTTVKDALPTAAMPSYRGSSVTPDDGVTGDWDAPAVARLKESGCVVMGKSTMCDYGIVAGSVSSRHGVTRNPWDLTRSAGASSAGAAASVAAGLSPLTLGTDIVGSIRIPASFCGLVGLKPSYGRVPYYPPSNPALVVGPMARDTADVALLLDVIAQPDSRDFTALPARQSDYLSQLDRGACGLRARLITDLGFGLALDPAVLECVTAAARALQAAGLSVDDPRVEAFDIRSVDLAESYYRARCYAELNKSERSRQPRSPLLWRWTRPAERESAEHVLDAQGAMLALREKTMRLIDGYDFLLLPTVPSPPFAAELAAPDEERLFDPWCNTFLFNLTEQPALSINCGFTPQGLPVGLQIVGRRYDDLGVLQLGRTYETVRAPQRPWPRL
jgi:Asp-tRNA(Asn)/Glu-tRNA(Gln) amidotransferase A subunit family amidase